MSPFHGWSPSDYHWEDSSPLIIPINTILTVRSLSLSNYALLNCACCTVVKT